MKFRTSDEYFNYIRSLPIEGQIAISRKEKDIMESTHSQEEIVTHYDCSLEEWKQKVGAKYFEEILSEIESDMKAKICR